MLAPALLIDALLLILLHLDTANVSHETLHEPLDLAIEVYVFMQVLRLRLAITKVLRCARQQAHRLRVRQNAKHRVEHQVEAVGNNLA